MREDWNDVQIFLAIERGGSARAAARSLKCSHSTILRRLDSFEKRIGTRLFDRVPEGFALADAGAAILSKAEQIEAEMLMLNRSISSSDLRLQGAIRLTVPPPVANYLLLPLLEQFKAEYPLIDVELVATYGYADLSRRHADIAIRFSDTPDGYLVGRQLPPFRDAIYATPAYIKEHWMDGVTNTAKWIGWPDEQQFRHRILTTPFPDTKLSWALPSLTLQTSAAKRGFGMAFLPCVIGDKETELSRVPNSDVYDEKPAWLLTHPDLRKMARVRVFSKFLAESIFANSDFVGGVLK